MDLFERLVRAFLIIFFIVHTDCDTSLAGGKYATFKDYITGNIVSCSKVLFNSFNENDCWLKSYRFSSNQTAEKCNFTFPSVSSDGSESTASNMNTMKLEFYKRLIYYEQLRQNISYIGLNITITASEVPSTQGYVFRVSKSDDLVRCFALEFNKTLPPEKSILLWNDVIALEIDGSDFRLEITEYPSQETRYFFSNVPPLARTTDPTTLKQWQALIFIEENLLDNSIAVMFKSAPERFGLINYTVRLISNNAEYNRVRPIFASKYEPFNRVLFKDLNTAEYNIIVECDECLPGVMQMNFLANTKDFVMTPSALIAISLSVVFFIICILLLFCFRPWRYLYKTKLASEDSAIRQVVILYSYDSDAHSALVGAFVNVLECNGIKVLFDKYRKEISPKKWLCNAIESANYVIIIWSEGAILKWGDKNENVVLNEPGNLTSQNFSQGTNWVLNRHVKGWRSTVANVCWQKRSFKSMIPNEFSGCKKFIVPSDWFKLLRFLRGDDNIVDSIYAPRLGRDPVKEMGEKFETAMNEPSAYILSKEEPCNLNAAMLPPFDQFEPEEPQAADSGNFSMPSNTTESFLSDVPVISDNGDQERLQEIRDILRGPCQIPQLLPGDHMSGGEELSREESIRAILQGDLSSLDYPSYNEQPSSLIVTDYRPNPLHEQQVLLLDDNSFLPQRPTRGFNASLA